ncbi:MAG TPA: hypothetical protein VGN14_12225 [Candidatus Elarobacter sp.]
MDRRFCSWAFLAVALLAGAGCAKQETTSTTTTTNAPPPDRSNPSDFPVYPGSTVVESAPVDYGAMFAIIKKNDPSAKVPGNWRGHEVVFSTGASFAALKSWVGQLKTAPPLGMHVTSSAGGFTFKGDGENGTASAGQLFQTADAKRAVFVLALDPKAVRQSLGPALDMIDKYNALPPMLRGPVDDQTKKQLGYSVSEMLDRRSPIGIVFATLRTMSGDRRAIVLIDESKS